MIYKIETYERVMYGQLQALEFDKDGNLILFFSSLPHPVTEKNEICSMSVYMKELVDRPTFAFPATRWVDSGFAQGLFYLKFQMCDER